MRFEIKIKSFNRTRLFFIILPNLVREYEFRQWKNSIISVEDPKNFGSIKKLQKISSTSLLYSEET